MSLTPGEPCPSCERRVPFPKTERTPPTKHKAYWLPTESYEAHHELIDAAAKHLGCYDQPFYEAKVMEVGVVLILQDANLEGFAK